MRSCGEIGATRRWQVTDFKMRGSNPIEGSLFFALKITFRLLIALSTSPLHSLGIISTCARWENLILRLLLFCALVVRWGQAAVGKCLDFYIEASKPIATLLIFHFENQAFFCRKSCPHRSFRVYASSVHVLGVCIAFWDYCTLVVRWGQAATEKWPILYIEGSNPIEMVTFFDPANPASSAERAAPSFL